MSIPSELIKTNSKYQVKDDIFIFTQTEDLRKDNKKYSGFYNVIANLYDIGSKVFFWFHGGEIKARKEFLEELKIVSGAKVLEVSIGTGTNISMLPKDADYFGVDISYGMLKKCQQNLNKMGRQSLLFQAEAEHLPFNDNTFDSVFHVGGVNYFNEKGKALAEMVRVSKSGTHLTIVDETDKFFETLSWIPFLKNAFPTGKATKPPTELLPSGMKNIQVSEIVNGNYWRLTFQKP
ncbi:class I SAM-dependent methyltransferase [Candidatus Woesebacteria bacterium]|nr:class I SAM-dependent methyltransferase [Candidatus Woesebacteria bacterium]